MSKWDDKILSAAEKISKGIEKGAEYLNSLNDSAPVSPRQARPDIGNTERGTKHCPSCGSVISSIDLFCSACGTSLEDNRVSSAAKDLADQLSAIDSQREGLIRNFIRTKQEKISEKATQKAQLIKSFPVPNTQKDLLEFIHMAASNINAGVLTGTSNSGLDEDALKSEKLLSQTWLDKMESVYQKAKSLLAGNTDISKIDNIYQSKIREIECLREEKRKKEQKSNRILIICIAALFLMLGALYYLTSVKPSETQKSNLEALVVEIREDIADGNYDEALLKTNKVRLKNGDTSEIIMWDETRESLIREIEAVRGNE